MGQPMVVASINYRLAHFGFSASKELEEAGLLNLGFEDQRNALHWIQKHIAKFGGDPKKVTIMGESAGSISVIQHLLASSGDTEGLYHAAIAMSGGPLKLEGPSRQQPLFDSLVSIVVVLLSPLETC
jgi:acetylcholinesterase